MRHDIVQPNTIALAPMTRALCRQFYQGFQTDPALYADPSQCVPYRYSDAWADAYFVRQMEKQRIHLAIMQGDAPVGEILLKEIDRANGTCSLSIHLQNDGVKGQGVGTAAERLALQYAFRDCGFRIVNADAIIANTRSQHVLEKVGFRFVREENGFRYYTCPRP